MDSLDLIKKQQVVVCNEKGKPTGEYFPRLEAHTGGGKKHLAIAVVLMNYKRQFLLQKRKHRIFDNFWDLTGATDLLHKPYGSHEDWLEATDRCLKREYSLKVIPLKNIGGFSYFRSDGSLCENEYCYLILGEYDGEVNLNPKVGYKYRWVDANRALQDIQDNLEKYTPWAQEAVRLLKKAI